MLKRKQDWPIRLEKAIDKAKNKRFIWGRHDCALFAASCVKAMTGEDFAADFRGHYTTKAGATKALKKYGGGDLDQTVTNFIGAALETVKKAGRGDVALVKTPEGMALGVVDLTGMRVAIVSAKGLKFLPLKEAIKAWRV